MEEGSSNVDALLRQPDRRSTCGPQRRDNPSQGTTSSTLPPTTESSNNPFASDSDGAADDQQVNQHHQYAEAAVVDVDDESVPILAAVADPATSYHRLDDEMTGSNERCIQERKFCTKRSALVCCCSAGLLVLLLLCVVGFQAWMLYKACRDGSCVRMDRVELSNTCGTRVSGNLIQLAFNVLVDLKLPEEKWLGLYVDNIELTVKESKSGKTIFHTPQLTPEFAFKSTPGKVVSRKILFGDAFMRFQDASLLFSEDDGSQLLAEAAWHVLNEIEGLRLDVLVELDVWSNSLFIPFTKHISTSFAYTCSASDAGDGGNQPVTCDVVQGTMPSRFSSETSDKQGILTIDLASVQFQPVEDPLTQLASFVTANISVDADSPALVASIPAIDDILVYVSPNKLMPTLQDLTRPGSGAVRIVQARTSQIEANRTFQPSFSAAIDISKEPHSLSALRMMASRYLSNDNVGQTFFLYSVFGNGVHRGVGGEACFVKQVLAQMQPIRVEMESLWQRQASLLQAETKEKPSLESVELTSITSEEDIGLISSNAVLRLPFSVSGTLPTLELLSSINQDIVDTFSFRTLETTNSTTASKQLALEIDTTVLLPDNIAKHIRENQIDTVELKIHGSSNEKLSLVSSILRDVKYTLSQEKNAKDVVLLAAEQKENDFGMAVVGVEASQEAVSLDVSFYLFKELTFRFTLSPCFLTGAPIVFSSPTDQENLSVHLNLTSFAFGNTTENRLQSRWRWSATDEGAALKRFLDDYNNEARTPFLVKKPGCLNIAFKSLPHFTSSTQRLNDESDVFIASLQMESASTNGTHPFNARCAISGTRCEQIGGPISTCSRWRLEHSKSPSNHFSFQDNRPVLRVINTPALAFSVNDGDGVVVIPATNGFNISYDFDVLQAGGEVIANVTNGFALYNLVHTDDRVQVKGTNSILSAAIATLMSETSNNQDERHYVAEEILVEIQSSTRQAGVSLTGKAPPSSTESSKTSLKIRVGIPYVSGRATANGDDGVLGSFETSRSGLWLNMEQLMHDVTFQVLISDKQEKSFQDFVAALVDDRSDLPIVALESLSTSSLSLRVELDLFGGISSPFSSSGKSPSLASSWTSPTVEIVNGVGSDGKTLEELNIPCVLPELCLKRPTNLNGKPYTTTYDLLLSFDLDSLHSNYLVERAFTLSLPAFSGVVFGYVHTDLIKFSSSAVRQTITLSSSAPGSKILSVPTRVQAVNIQVLADAVRDVLGSVYPMTFGLQFAPDQGLLPMLFDKANLVWTIQPTSPDGRPVLVPKSQQWWFPLASVGAWEMLDSTTNSAHFAVNMTLKNPAPVAVRFRNVSGAAYYLSDYKMSADKRRQALQFATFAIDEGDLYIQPDGFTSQMSSLFMVGDAVVTKKMAYCSPASISNPQTRMNCVPSSLLEQLISGIETHILMRGKFVNPKGRQITVNFEAILHEGGTRQRIQPYKPAPRYAIDLPSAARASAMDEFISVFDTVKVSGWSSAYSTLLKKGINLAVQVAIHNPFVFPFKVLDYNMTLQYDDPTGEYLSYLPASYSPQFNIPLVTNLRTDNLGLFVNPDSSRLTPTQTVQIKEKEVELICRLYNAAEKVLSLCGSLPSGTVNLAIGNFAWTQNFAVFNVSLVGSDACHTQPGCYPQMALTNVLQSSALEWSVVGSASEKKNVGALRLTQGKSLEVGAAWVTNKLPVSDGFEVEFQFLLEDNSLAGGGDGFAFVVQRDGGPRAIGQRCFKDPCNGYQNLTHGGPSFALILFRSDRHYVELHGIVDGQSANRVGFASAKSLTPLANGRKHTMKIFYSRNDRKIYVYTDGRWQATFSVWEPAQVDTGTCSAGNAKPSKSACVDMDAIGGQDGSAWVGFTASTGNVMTSIQSIFNFTLRNQALSAASSYVLEQGRMIGTVGQTATFTIDVRDSCHGPIRAVVSSKGVVNVTVVAEKSSTHLPVNVLSHPWDGVVRCNFVPPVAGTFSVFLHQGFVNHSIQVLGPIGNISIWEKPPRNLTDITEE